MQLYITGFERKWNLTSMTQWVQKVYVQFLAAAEEVPDFPRLYEHYHTLLFRSASILDACAHPKWEKEWPDKEGIWKQLQEDCLQWKSDKGKFWKKTMVLLTELDFFILCQRTTTKWFFCLFSFSFYFFYSILKTYWQLWCLFIFFFLCTKF